MALVAFEDFEGGTVGANINNTNTIFDASGSGTFTLEAGGYSGQRALSGPEEYPWRNYSLPTAQDIVEVDILLKTEILPTPATSWVGLVTINVPSGVDAVLEIRDDGTISCDGTSSGHVSTYTVAAEEWFRGVLKYERNVGTTLDLYFGANINGLVPDESVVGWGAQNLAAEDVLIGKIGSAGQTWLASFDSMSVYDSITPPAVFVDFTLTDTIPAITDEIAALADGGPSGRLDDFGLWVSGDNDAAITRVVAFDVGDNADWVRTSTTATRPRDYFLSRGSGPVEDELLWRRAEYGVASPKWASVVADEANLLDAIQFEKQTPARNLLSGNASAFEQELVYGDWWNLGYLTGAVERNNTDVTPYNGEWVLKVTAGTTAGVSSFHPVPEEGMARVEEGVEYIGSLRIKSGFQTVPLTNAFDVQIRFYDSDFVELASSTPTYYTVPDDAWYRFYRFSGVAPAGAAWASVTAICQGGHWVEGDVWYVDDIRLTRYTPPTPTDWDEARRVIINLRADSINYVKNPMPYYDEFGYGWMRGWFVEADGGVTTSQEVDQLVYLYGDTSCRIDVTSTGTGTAGVLTEDVKYEGPEFAMISGLLPNTPYVASAWVLRDSDAEVSCVVRHNGEPEVTGFNYSTVLTENLYDENYVQTDGDGNQWVRVFCPFILEANTLAGGSQIVFAVYLDGAMVSGDSLRVNAMQVQEGSVPTEYFDGSLFTSETPDYLWEENTLGSAATPFQARSHWYNGRRAKVSRVYDVVEKNLPKDTPYYIRFAQPAKERRILRDVYGNPLS